MVKVCAWVCGWVCCLVFLGCGSTDRTATGPHADPRDPNCEFDILTTTPLLGYREIGTIDVTPGAYGHNLFTDLSSFKEHIRPDVCQLGGDAAIASANGNGWYIKASVLKRVEEKRAQPTAQAAAAVPAAAPVAAPAPRPVGCEYDTQCKGDRVCVEAKCVDPAPKAAAPAEAAAAPAAPKASSAPAAAKAPAPVAAPKATPAAAH